MVSPPSSISHAPPHHRPSSPRNRARNHLRVLCLSPPVAAPLRRRPTARRRRHAANREAASGLRIPGGVLGNRSAAASRGALQAGVPGPDLSRSEEHTSELQSLRHLVCRLLLEKKNSLTQREGSNDGGPNRGLDCRRRVACR